MAARYKRNWAGILRVAIDATYQRQPDGGIPRYARHLTAALRARGDIDIVEIGGGKRQRRKTMRRRLVTIGVDFVWHPLLGSMRAAAVGADVYHSLGFRGPLRRGRVPTVVTVHDLVSLRFPELASPSAKLYGNMAQRRMSLIADIVVCASTDSANDVERFFGVPSDCIRITPLGVDEIFFAAPRLPAPATEPYVLFVGSEQPRKNLERLEQAMVLLRARGFPHVLVTAGADAWGRVDIGASFLRRLGFVSDEQLVSLYAGASCLAIPSLHEGFGLPALEAMAAGTAVVASRIGALPEVTGGAAVLVDPLDTADIADGLERAIMERDTLVERGRQRAALFTWDRTATMTAAIYRDLV
jgi:glycosyltransferase involved in cell wall biosynthesis